jgi:hypothetical protein
MESQVPNKKIHFNFKDKNRIRIVRLKQIKFILINNEKCK